MLLLFKTFVQTLHTSEKSLSSNQSWQLLDHQNWFAKLNEKHEAEHHQMRRLDENKKMILVTNDTESKRKSRSFLIIKLNSDVLH